MSATAAWACLIAPGVLEVGSASLLPLTERFTRFWPSVGFLLRC